MRKTKEENKLTNNESAITLIALVITIIVLLILAGVTIVTLTGDNGLITKASDAQKESLKAEGLEKLQVEIAGSYDNYGQIDSNQLRTNLQHIADIKTVDDEEITDSTTIELPMIVKINSNEYLIKADGTIKVKYGIDQYDIANFPTTYYGRYVTNYDSQNDAGIIDAENQLGKWQIFMADEDNIYLIASNYITAQYTAKKNNIGYYTYNSTSPTKMWFTNMLGQYNAGTTETDIPEILSKLDKQSIYHKWMNNADNQKRNYDSEKAVSSMLDVTVWNGYNNTTYAKYAIGGPTLEMLFTSYNSIVSSGKVYTEYDDVGYKIKKANNDPVKHLSLSNPGLPFDKMYFSCAYWLASPYSSNNIMVANYRWIDGYSKGTTDFGFRPLICLKSNVHLIENSDGQTYSLELN